MTAFDGVGAGSAGRVSQPFSRAAWASCPSGTCSDCEVLAALVPERSARNSRFASGDSRKRWPGPGQDESPVNPQWSAERRAALVTRAAAVPGNGCSSGLCLATGCSPAGAPVGAPLPSVFGGSKKLNNNSDADASRERDCLSAPAIAGEGDRAKRGGGGAGGEENSAPQVKLRCKRPAHRASAIADALRRRHLEDGGRRPPMPPSPLSRGGMKRRVA